MVQKQKSPEKYRPVKPTPSPAKAPAPTAKAKEDAEPVSAVKAESEPAIVATALTTIVFPPHGEAKADDTTVEFDIGDLPFKTLDFLTENAFAILDHATELSRAASLSEVIELQSRFTRERYSTFLKQVNDINDTGEIMRYLTSGARFSIRQSFGSFAI
jgi:hypothetical protein